MFMVGVALPWSLASRSAQGQSKGMLFLHALWRSAMLILLSVFLQSNQPQPKDKIMLLWSFENVLAQIGLAYPFLFLLSFTRPRTQWIAAFVILLAYWLAFVLYPVVPADFDWQSVREKGKDVTPYFTGFWSHWEKNGNLASHVDQWFLNLFPRKEPYVFNGGGYQTINFIPSIATMVFGMLAGQLLRDEIPIEEKLKQLLIASAVWLVAWKGI